MATCHHLHNVRLPSIPRSLSPYRQLPKFHRSISVRRTVPVKADTSLSTGANPSPRHTYIVHVRRPDNLLSSDVEGLQNYYIAFLPKTDSDSSSSPHLLYSYSKSMSCFAARLTEEEASAMSSIPGFLDAHRSQNYHLMTTHTPTFLGLLPNAGLWCQSNRGEGVIIGVFDTGVDSTHPSFSDEGMSPPPTHWKSICQLPSGCNKKLIGARAFCDMFATDTVGHGTHTASTAVGNFVEGAEFLGQASGTASGIAPRAHLAVYQVCSDQCFAEDLRLGFISAIEDGIDVGNVSIGGPSTPFQFDPIAISGLQAFFKGITFVCAAGNKGPKYASLSNEAPWLITVGSSTLDRVLKTIIRLGDGQEFVGEALFQPKDFSSEQYPLIAPSSCLDLSVEEVEGKIVLCETLCHMDFTFGRCLGSFVQAAGGVAVIIRNRDNEGATIVVRHESIPSSHVTFEDGVKIAAYAADSSTPNPTASIQFCGTMIGSPDPSVPVVSHFSSRGPSKASPGILKPDIIAPGNNVFAAWPPITENSIITSRDPSESFNIISGTSMATPHISDVVALLKNAHPNWSPTAIKSAIMTTADVLDNQGNLIMDEKLKPADFFALGAGHVNPEKASDPGLIYDITGDDFIQYLCGLDYSDKNICLISGLKAVSCAQLGKITEAELNYPSILVVMNATGVNVTVNRTATNVGEAASFYTVEVESPKGVRVTVNPTELKFREVWEEKTFSITFEKTGSEIFVPGSWSEGSLKWVSAKHTVRSPIVVMH